MYAPGARCEIGEGTARGAVHRAAGNFNIGATTATRDASTKVWSKQAAAVRAPGGIPIGEMAE